MKKEVTIKDIILDNKLDIVYESSDLSVTVKSEMICQPSIEIAGLLDYYDKNRIVLIGSKETSYIKTLDYELARQRVYNILINKPPLIVYTVNVILPDIILELAKKFDITVCKCNLRTVPASSKLYTYLQESLAPKISIHGTLLDIHGLGTLIIGKSAVGKSETALDLIKRGHQLISDDLVEIFEKEPGSLIGQAPDSLKRYIEIRGIGIVDVVHMFGASAYRPKKNIKLVIELEQWQEDNYYDRLGTKIFYTKFFDTEIRKIKIPVLPGRNVALLVESASMQEKLRLYMGYNDANRFIENLEKRYNGGNK